MSEIFRRAIVMVGCLWNGDFAIALVPIQSLTKFGSSSYETDKSIHVVFI